MSIRIGGFLINPDNVAYARLSDEGTKAQRVLVHFTCDKYVRLPESVTMDMLEEAFEKDRIAGGVKYTQSEMVQRKHESAFAAYQQAGKS